MNVTEQQSQLKLACRNLLDINFAATHEDRLVFIHDGKKRDFAQALLHECVQRQIECSVLELGTEESSELPEYMQDALLSCSVSIISTNRSYTHSAGVRRAADNGMRCATNALLEESELVEGLLANYGKIAQCSAHYANLLDCANVVRVRTGKMAELQFAIGTKRGQKETGLIASPGGVSNLPAGEAACGIDEGTGDGVLIVNGSFPGLGLLSSPLELHFERGVLVDVRGRSAKSLERMLKPHGVRGRMLAELGIGTNPSCRMVGKTVVDEKVAGTLHIAIGNDVSFGGSNAIGFHADAVLLGAQLLLDDALIQLPDEHSFLD